MSMNNRHIQSPVLSVKINSASRDELALLHGIGPTLADRIVRERESRGPFSGPMDLAKVKGIPLSLATTLAPHLDWGVADQPLSTPSRGNSARRVALIGIAWIFVVLVLYLGQVNAAVRTFERGVVPGTINLVRVGVFVAALLNASVFIALWMRSEEFEPRDIPVLRTMLVLSLILGAIRLVTFAAQFYAWKVGVPVIAPSRMFWLEFGFTLFVAFFVVLSIAMTTGRIGRAHLGLLATTLTISVCFGMAYLLVQVASSPSAGAVVLTLGMGISLVFISVVGLRTGQNPIRLSLEAIFDVIGIEKEKTRVYWSKWINTLVPDPTDQQQLLEALRRMHPTSKTRTLLNLIVLTVGGWFLITALNSIVDYLVQHWLQVWFPFK